MLSSLETLKSRTFLNFVSAIPFSLRLLTVELLFLRLVFELGSNNAQNVIGLFLVQQGAAHQLLAGQFQYSPRRIAPDVPQALKRL